MKKKFERVFQFTVTLKGVKPAVWRRFQVPESYTFWDLHVAIQDVFGWDDYHLHEFELMNPESGEIAVQFDQGGLVYQPLIGLHHDVAEIDFVSMYPSIMARFNISPETVGSQRPTAETVPELGMIVDQGAPGLVPQTLKPLLDKRLALKERLATLPAWDPRRQRYKACTSAHKWLLVTCFGYLGYKNARFGRTEAHEAVTAYGREALLRAKEAAEEQGFTVLHMYVDGLWVKKEGVTRVPQLQPLLDEIARRTGLPIARLKNPRRTRISIMSSKAVDELLAGKAVSIKQTKPYGCSVKYPPDKK